MSDETEIVYDLSKWSGTNVAALVTSLRKSNISYVLEGDELVIDRANEKFVDRMVVAIDGEEVEVGAPSDATSSAIAHEPGGLLGAHRRVRVAGTALGVVAAVALIALVIVVVVGGGQGDRESAPTTLDVDAIIEATPGYKCATQLWEVVAAMVDTRSQTPAINAWGVSGPAYTMAIRLSQEARVVAYQEGVTVAGQRLGEWAAAVCTDADVANDVLNSQEGDPQFLTTCLDGVPPTRLDFVCIGN